METKAHARTENHPMAEPLPEGRFRRFPARLKGEQQTKTLRAAPRFPSASCGIPRGLPGNSPCSGLVSDVANAKGRPCEVRGERTRSLGSKRGWARLF